MIFQKNVLLYFLVLKCVKVGKKCFVGEGLTPATSDVEKVIHLCFKTKGTTLLDLSTFDLNYQTKVLAKYKSCLAATGKVLQQKNGLCHPTTGSSTR